MQFNVMLLNLLNYHIKLCHPQQSYKLYIEAKNFNIDFTQPIVVPNGEHPLQFTYCLWFSRRAPGKHAAPQSFDQNLKMVGRFGSVEQFWSYYCHLVRPCELTGHSDFHLFKDGIKPMWEVSKHMHSNILIVSHFCMFITL